MSETSRPFHKTSVRVCSDVSRKADARVVYTKKGPLNTLELGSRPDSNISLKVSGVQELGCRERRWGLQAYSVREAVVWPVRGEREMVGNSDFPCTGTVCHDTSNSANDLTFNTCRWETSRRDCSGHFETSRALVDAHQTLPTRETRPVLHNNIQKGHSLALHFRCGADLQITTGLLPFCKGHDETRKIAGPIERAPTRKPRVSGAS